MDNNLKSLFYQREGKALRGKGNRNLWFLTGILFISFLGFGFAIGMQGFLQNKLDDPLINWVKVDVPVSKDEDKVSLKIDDLQKLYDEKGDSLPFDIVQGYAYQTVYIWNHNQNKFFPTQARSLQEGPLMDLITSEENNYKGRPAFDMQEDYGLIVSRQLLKDFGYEEEGLEFLVIDGGTDSVFNDFKINIPVMGVSDHLPEGSSVAFSEFAWKAFYSRPLDPTNPFHKADETFSHLRMYVAMGDDEKLELREILEDYFEQEVYNPENYPLARTPGKEFSILLEPRLNYLEMEAVFEKLKADEVFAPYKDRAYLLMQFDDREVERNQFIVYEGISFHLTDLERIEELEAIIYKEFNRFDAENHIKEKSHIRLDWEKIEEKKSYQLLSRMVMIVSVILLGLSVLSIVIYLLDILNSHFRKIQMNLGTIMAFGLAEQQALKIYGVIIFKFVGVAGAVGTMAGYGIATVLLFLLLPNLVSHFEPLWLLLAFPPILILFGLSIAVSYLTLKKYLKKFPGDLIYLRD